MLSLILLVIFGLGMAFFATQNTGMLHIWLGNYLLSGIPLYVVVIVSLLLGVVASWIISLADNFSSILTLHWKDSELKKAHKTIDELIRDNNELELENTRLKERVNIKPSAAEETNLDHTHDDSIKPSLFPNIRPSFR